MQTTREISPTWKSSPLRPKPLSKCLPSMTRKWKEMKPSNSLWRQVRDTPSVNPPPPRPPSGMTITPRRKSSSPTSSTPIQVPTGICSSAPSMVSRTTPRRSPWIIRSCQSRRRPTPPMRAPWDCICRSTKMMIPPMAQPVLTSFPRIRFLVGIMRFGSTCS